MFQNYDLVAPFYPILETAAFGDALNKARSAFLEPIVNAEKTLLIGEGNGRFLAACLKDKKGGSITVIDSSRKMLSLLRSRIQALKHETTLELVHADFLCWEPVASAFDVIVTHFVLDLFRPNSQRRLIEKITTLSKSETLWVNVDFRPMIQSTLHGWIDWLQYRFDRAFSGIEAERYYNPADIIKDFGWIPREERLFCDQTVLARSLVRNRGEDAQESLSPQNGSTARKSNNRIKVGSVGSVARNRPRLIADLSPARPPLSGGNNSSDSPS